MEHASGRALDGANMLEGGPDSVRRPLTQARMASTSDPAQAMSASPNASSVTRRYEARTVAVRTVAFVASIPSSFDILVLLLAAPALLDAPVDDGARGVAVELG